MQAPPSQPVSPLCEPPSAPAPAAEQAVHLVLSALAHPSAPDRPALLLPHVAEALATLTGWPQRPLAMDRPGEALGTLTAETGPWLAPLLQDPGLPLAGGSWAEHLGAWRQPTLLVVTAEELATGLPAAAAALLEHWRVPLLGLLQWGGSWDGAARQRDGLPWLGLLEPRAGAAQADEAALVLRLNLNLRWRRLAALLA